VSHQQWRTVANDAIAAMSALQRKRTSQKPLRGRHRSKSPSRSPDNGHRDASSLAADVWGDDARGDAEAFLEMKRMGLKISF
jgi:hypothetical protein